jgi:threonine dehydrogenase-like Zn-dependent dehydrogenase
MAVMSARIQGASQIFVVDGQEDRLALAEQIGATPINMKGGDVGDQIRELTGGRGADCGANCVGYQCHNAYGKEVPNLVMNSLVDAVKATGILDRLTDQAHIIETGSESYRFRRTLGKKRKE